MAGLLYLIRPRFAPLVVSAVVFICVDRLVLRAIEEKRLQSGLERIGERLRPLVGREEGLVVVVSSARIDISPEERMTKATYAWRLPQAGRFWIIRPDEAKARFGPRTGCRRAESLDLDRQTIRWPVADEPIRLVLWDASRSDEPDLEPYFRGCPVTSSRDLPPDR